MKFYCLDCPKEVSKNAKRCSSCSTKNNSWNRGLTAKTDPRVKKNGENIWISRRKNGTIHNNGNKKGWETRRKNGTDKHSDITKKNISIGILNSEIYKNAIKNPERSKNISLGQQRRKERDGYICSPEAREKISQKTLKMYKNGKFKIQSNSASLLFDQLEKIFDIKLEREHLLKDKLYDAKWKNYLFESDGSYWHSRDGAKENDEYKNKLAQENNYHLFRFKNNSIEDVKNIIDQNYDLFKSIFMEI